MSPTPEPKLGKSTRVPKTLTPHALKIIRLLASGKTKAEVAAEADTTYQYIYRLMTTQMAKDEFAKISTAVESATIAQIASSHSGTDSTITTAVTAEVDASVLEAIQRLRHIMNNATSSQAQALAAKELLDLGQAKKRLALLDKGLEDGIEVSPDDVHLLAQTVGDLRLLHMTNLSGPQRESALRRFSATDADIEATRPEEMDTSHATSPSTDDQSAPVTSTDESVEIADPTTLQVETVQPVPPSIPQGPTLDDMLNG